MNIIYDEKLIPSFTGVKSNSESLYKPNELTFYVPQIYSDYSTYIIIQNDSLHDVVPLTFMEDKLGYQAYGINETQEMRINGFCEICLLLLKKSTAKISFSFSSNLEIEQYKIVHQVYLIHQISREIADIYSKIEKLTNMNIDIYDQIRYEGRSKQ